VILHLPRITSINTLSWRQGPRDPRPEIFFSTEPLR
jgi:hypothetical protein